VKHPAITLSSVILAFCVIVVAIRFKAPEKQKDAAPITNFPFRVGHDANVFRPAPEGEDPFDTGFTNSAYWTNRIVSSDRIIPYYDDSDKWFELHRKWHESLPEGYAEESEPASWGADRDSKFSVEFKGSGTNSVTIELGLRFDGVVVWRKGRKP
jgi:hypothetical protein